MRRTDADIYFMNHLKHRLFISTRCGFCVVAALFFAAWFIPAAPASSQEPGQADEFQNKLDKLTEEVDDLKDKLKKLKDDKSAESLLTFGNVELRLGGKVEFNFLVPQEDVSLQDLGAGFLTERVDPYMELQRLRLSPVFALNRWIRVQSQLDFEAMEGDTILKELVVRHDVQPWWWLRSRFQLGIDDRFIRPARRTKTYPLIGNAMWRDESLAAVWQLTFGHKKGTAAARKRFDKKGGPAAAAGGGAFTEGFDEDSGTGDEAAGAALRGPFDFANNWGAFNLFLSLGQGYQLGNKEVGFGQARFNEIVQDDRELEDDLAFGELGIGMGWRRSFERLGELGISGFYFDDNLRQGSLDFLQGEQMTNRLNNSVVSGYGGSMSDNSSRCGVSLDYFLPSTSIFPRWRKNVRKQDGLRFGGQYLNAEDGKLTRKGWYTQASYHFSFGKLLADRYFRSIEPLVRYGTLDVDAPGDDNGSPFKSPSLPGTWDRRALTLGALVEVTGDVFMKIEYVMHSEDGAGVDVDNDELLIQLLLTFE